jgi:hypothetical protein
MPCGSASIGSEAGAVADISWLLIGPVARLLERRVFLFQSHPEVNTACPEVTKKGINSPRHCREWWVNLTLRPSSQGGLVVSISEVVTVGHPEVNTEG